jgi:hypothetical protein
MQEASKVSTINCSCSIRNLTESDQDSRATENSQVVGMAATNPPPLIGTSIREIQSIAKALKSSTTQFLSTIPDQSTQLALKTFMDNVLASASKIEVISGSLVTAGAIGQFIFFSKLPIEIRLSIWELALPGPRVIEVFKTWTRECGREWKSGIQVNNPPLSLFHVNREAREVALNNYMLLADAPSSNLYFCDVRFDPNNDTIFIPWSTEQGGFQGGLIYGDSWSAEARTKVQYLAIDSRMWEKYDSELVFVSCKALKEFTIVIHEGEEDESDSFRPTCFDKWRMRDTDLALEEPRWMDGENAEEHIKFIEMWHDIVLERMAEESETAKACGIEWSIPKVHVRILTRNRGTRCCWKEEWGY